MEVNEIKSTSIFRNLTDEECKQAIREILTGERTYKKGQLIFHAGSEIESMGVVLSGSVTIENNDIWGNRTILSLVGTGNFFAETYAFLPDEALMVDVVANEDCRVAFLNLAKLRRAIQKQTLQKRATDFSLQKNPQDQIWMTKLMMNLLDIMAHKNLNLSERSSHTAPKTIRGRVMSYLYTRAVKKHSTKFDIPFDRQQMADYLNLERSALSKELGKMQRDGQIKVKKNHFELLGH